MWEVQRKNASSRGIGAASWEYAVSRRLGNDFLYGRLVGETHWATLHGRLCNKRRILHCPCKGTQPRLEQGRVCESGGEGGVPMVSFHCFLFIPGVLYQLSIFTLLSRFLGLFPPLFHSSFSLVFFSIRSRLMFPPCFICQTRALVGVISRLSKTWRQRESLGYGYLSE